MRGHELSENQWQKLKNLLPVENKPQGGYPTKDNRIMLNAMVYWLNIGIEWRDNPNRFGLWKIVYTRYRRWIKNGVFEKFF